MGLSGLFKNAEKENQVNAFSAQQASSATNENGSKLFSNALNQIKPNDIQSNLQSFRDQKKASTQKSKIWNY